MKTKIKNYDWDREFKKICDRKNEFNFAMACFDKCFFIKKAAYDHMIGVYRQRQMYLKDYDPPISRFIANNGKEYYRFFGNKDAYLEFKSHFWDAEWNKYFYY